LEQREFSLPLYVCPSIGPILSALLVTLIVGGNQHYTAYKYIEISKRQGISNLKEHCRKKGQEKIHNCWVFEAEGKIVGFIVICAGPSRVKEWLPPFKSLLNHPPEMLAKIEWLVVDTTFRRRGVARELITKAEGFVRKIKNFANKTTNRGLFSHLRLCVTSKQVDGVKFYKGCGYHSEHTSDGDMYMVKALSAP
jgi:ribosomal protein S18 acetylase RimI-like enzyme